MKTNIINNTLDAYVCDLINYYRDKGLTIIGLNDSQGVNTTSTFFKKGLLEYIAAALTNGELNPTVINSFSLLMNKTEHIDYFLQSNLSLKEIKLSQVYSVVSALEKVMEDVNMPKCIGKVGYLYRLVCSPKKGDSEILISSALKNSIEPTVIYSSGVNNLMREVGNNPFAIKKDYQDRNIRPNYDYTVSKANDPKTLDKIFEGVEKNFINILSINNDADIYTLGAYVPKSLKEEGMDIFRNLVIEYNDRLERLCKFYNITYINTEDIGNKYNNSSNNFHVSSLGHNMLANSIIESMHERKFNNQKCISIMPQFNITNTGPSGIIHSTYDDCIKNIELAKNMSGYERTRQFSIINENLRENEVFTKVLKSK